MASCWVAACGSGDGRGSGDAEGSGSASLTSASQTGGTEDGSGSGSATAATTVATSTAATSDTSPDTTAGADTQGVIFDVGMDTEGTTGEEGCGCGNPYGFSYIWIANSTQGTVTKLNTQTMMEEGRYLTRPDGVGNPSRTSVSIDARAVAVANRAGGLVKVWALAEFCDPNTNGQAGVQTSNDLNYLPWGQDDCIAWYVPFPYTTQRPVAWGPGTLNEVTCEYEEQVVWTGGCAPGQHTWAQVHRVDGDTGVVLDTIDVTNFECSSLSPYGAAIDPNGDYWMTNLVPGNDRLAHIDVGGNLIEVITPPITPYGMTVDRIGRVWLASWSSSGSATAARYTPETAMWDLANNHVVNVLSGIQEDADGRMWMNYWTYDNGATPPGLVYVDGDTMEVSEAFPIGCGSYSCRGISIDLDGNVWSTSMGENRAFRFNPDSLQIDTYDQLVGPYTYSDMTGWALQNTSCQPEG